MSPETVRLLDAARRDARARGGGRGAAPGHGGHRALAAAGCTAASRSPGHRRSARPGSRSRAASWTTRSPWPRAAGRRRGARSAPRSRSCSTTAAPWPAPSLRDRDGRRRTIRARLTVGADGLRSVVARRIGRAATGCPGRRRVRRPRRWRGGHGRLGGAVTSARAGYVGTQPDRRGPHQRRAGGARPSGPARHAGGAEAFFLEALDAFPAWPRASSGGRLVRQVLATGPFAAWSGRVVADGAALVGDAADFFDPFTGEGIYSALRGAELLADAAGRRSTGAARSPPAQLAAYRRARRRAFAGKWAVERLIGYGMLFPALFDRAVERLGRRPGMADTLDRRHRRLRARPPRCSTRSSSRGCCSEPGRESIPPASASSSAASRPGVTVLTVREPRRAAGRA